VELPGDYLILFDGECQFCAHSVRFIIRHDRQALFQFVSIQTQLGRKICEQYGHEINSMQTFLLLKKGVVYSRSAAAIEVAKELDWPWRVLSIFWLVPRPLRDAIYAVIARNRAKLFRKRDLCKIPSGEVRKRFLQ
jgi:predicted DCC family thiol-disulfide oxidoreductase YuxK